MIYEIEKDKNNTRLVVGALRRGISSKSREIAQEITTRTGKEMKIATVSSILSRISDSGKCDLARFIRKEKAGNAMVYLLVNEAKTLSESHAYGLTLKTGEDRYPLERAMGEYPSLVKFVEPVAKPASSRSTVRVDRTPADAMKSKRLIRLQSAPDRPMADRKMEISFRYSSQYAVSLTASLSTLFLLCSILILTAAAFFTLIYIFFYPFLVIAAITAGLSGAGVLIWRATRNRRKT